MKRKEIDRFFVAVVGVSSLEKSSVVDLNVIHIKYSVISGRLSYFVCISWGISRRQEFELTRGVNEPLK